MNPHLDLIASDVPATMTSREIAELTGKQHAHVMRDIRAMIEKISADPNLDWHCAIETYTDEQDKPREMYRMDKDTTLTLVSGYDALLRFRIIKRWQELEAKEVPTPAELTREQILLMALESERERLRLKTENATLNTRVMTMQPKSDFYDHVAEAKRSSPVKMRQKSCVLARVGYGSHFGTGESSKPVGHRIRRISMQAISASFRY